VRAKYIRLHNNDDELIPFEHEHNEISSRGLRKSDCCRSTDRRLVGDNPVNKDEKDHNFYDSAIAYFAVI